MRVYYFSEAKWAVENIAKRRIKACRFYETNDPFELFAGDLSHKQHRERMKHWAEALNQQFGLLCFTTGWRDSLMWSHYGDRHRGICLGFDVDDNILKVVNYSPERITFACRDRADDPAPPERVKELLLTTKFARWRYENERRVVDLLTDLRKEEDRYFRDFDDRLRLVQVIAGHRCSVEWKAKIENAIGGFSEPVDLIKARLAFRAFRVTTQKRGFDDPRVWQ